MIESIAKVKAGIEATNRDNILLLAVYDINIPFGYEEPEKVHLEISLYFH